MKKTLCIISSLVLGCMVTSCQNDVEVVMNESGVMPVAVTTRTSIDEPVDDVQYVSLDAARSVTINGPSIMVGTNEYTFEVSAIVSGTNLSWSYTTSLIDYVSNTTAGIKLKLKNSGIVGDAYVTAIFRDPNTNSIVYSVTKNVGANGPHYADCSIRVVRSSDGVEAYPSSYGLRPNTWYYGYFSTTTGASLSLRWVFNSNPSYNYYGTPIYFQSPASGYDGVTVYGTLSGSSVEKQLLYVTLYGGYGAKGTEDENTEETEEED